jgi:aspartate kinase
MQNSALSFSVCGIISNKNLLVLVAELQKNYIVKYNDKVNLLTIRNFKNLDIPKSLKDQEILIQQRSRTTIRYVLK